MFCYSMHRRAERTKWFGIGDQERDYLFKWKDCRSHMSRFPCDRNEAKHLSSLAGEQKLIEALQSERRQQLPMCDVGVETEGCLSASLKREAQRLPTTDRVNLESWHTDALSKAW